MGYLDEAIRDHLALQRKRGVAREELERAEAEALGPVAESDLVESVSERTAEDADEAPEAEQADSPPESEAEQDEGTSQPTEAYDIADLDELLDDGPQRESRPEPTLDRGSRPLPEPTLDEARSGSSDGPAEPDRDSDDPLEATPDFLQETPEHDRLWFEQKPPKDFDF